MRWRVKSLIQKVLGYVPGGPWLHYQLQRRVGGLRDFRAEFESKVDDWTIMAGHLGRAGRSIPGARLLEIGTGWYPTFAFACYLAGAERMVTVDLKQHLKPDLTLACARRLGDHLGTIAARTAVATTVVAERHRHLLAHLHRNDRNDRIDLADATAGVIDYRAPADARSIGLAAASMDCVFSNSVLEHVSADEIEAIFVEAKRILRPAGIMFHSVNCGDHYAYVDKSISQVNYLRYSDRAWRLWQNAFLYQNRLRAHQFVEMSRRAGFAITLNTAVATEIQMRDLREVPVHPTFSCFSPEQLCITTIDFISRKPEATEPRADAA
jgi:SAM-dependent methyltransferase